MKDPNRINHTSDHQTEPPSEDTTCNTAPQPDDGDTAGAVEEEQAQPEASIPV
jgi:hypothetical protein